MTVQIPMNKRLWDVDRNKLEVVLTKVHKQEILSTEELQFLNNCKRDYSEEVVRLVHKIEDDNCPIFTVLSASF